MYSHLKAEATSAASSDNTSFSIPGSIGSIITPHRSHVTISFTSFPILSSFHCVFVVFYWCFIESYLHILKLKCDCTLRVSRTVAPFLRLFVLHSTSPPPEQRGRKPRSWGAWSFDSARFFEW